MRTQDIIYLAGLLEGEGCFRYEKRRVVPSITLGMTDEDVVEKAATLLGSGVVTRRAHLDKPWKPCYVSRLNGRAAAGWMMTLYPLLGKRRQAKIREILSLWKNDPLYKRAYRMERRYSKNRIGSN